VPPFSLALLPAALAPWVADIADRVQCPPDFVAVGVMVAAAAVIGRQVAIRPKRQDDWAVVPTLWGLAVGAPGSMKSPALAEALRPLRRLVTDAQARDEEHRLAQRMRVAEQKARRGAVEAFPAGFGHGDCDRQLVFVRRDLAAQLGEFLL
jgi:putative DNA primase/helicase